MTQSTVVVRVDDELKTAFAEAAKATDRTASQLLRDFMRDFVRRQSEVDGYDTWFRQQVEAGIADARAGRVRSGQAVETDFAKRRNSTRKTLARTGRS